MSRFVHARILAQIRFTAIGLIVAIFACGTAAAAPRVLVSIKPLHALVSAVMEGAGAPELLLTGAASPHSYALKPSDARKIAQADVIFWTGPALETFLGNPLANLAPHAKIVALIEAPGIMRLPARTGGVWEGDEDEHTGGIDGHIWLDPENAIAIARAAARTLSAADPANAPRYSANADRLMQELMRLDGELARRLAPIRGRPYLVFHDAFHYLENRYGLTPAGAVTVAADRPVGVRRIENLRARIKAAGPICLFSTPQFSPRLVTALTQGSQAKIGVLDDLGADIPAGPQLYEILMTRLADALTACVAG